MKNILSPEECLALSTDNNNVVFVDGSWHMPNTNRNARAEYEAGPRIAGAKYFDVDDVANKDLPLPHMMPSATIFGKAMDALGITNSDRVIVYGGKGCFATPRTWYTFKAFGHDQVHLMNGGLEDWISVGGAVDTDVVTSMRVADLDGFDDTIYQAKSPTNIVDLEEMRRVCSSYAGNDDNEESSPLIVDARSAGRFNGTDKEPRPGLRGGHMPGAKNLVFIEFHDSSDPLKFKSVDEMEEILNKYDVPRNRKIYSTCGTGVTACSLALALDECGRDSSLTYIYDGSWTEWANPELDTPVVK